LDGSIITTFGIGIVDGNETLSQPGGNRSRNITGLNASNETNSPSENYFSSLPQQEVV